MTTQQITVEGVNDGKPFVANYPTATGWTVDDRGFLHVLGSGENRTVATYAPAYWGFVTRPVVGGEPDEHEGQANVR